MKIIVNADDFANSLHMSEVICECHDKGALNSTSIMVTSSDLNASLALLEGRADMRTSLHLNIAEGTPISKPEKIDYLVDANGKFCKSFETVVFDYYLGNTQKKHLIKQQIKEEYKNQIELYASKLQQHDISLDSHQHYHTIPFISEILMELSHELKTVHFTYIRVPQEPFFICLNSLQDVKNYLGLNIIKHLLLNFFSRQLRRKLAANQIACNDVFVGVLFTGNMTYPSILKALSQYDGKQSVEILLHPAFLSKSEDTAWPDDKFKEFYVNQHRKNERDILLLDQFKDFIQKLNKASV
ncbi:carbohydrate deacetylase [Sulfurospirillum sp. 1612]|uniref:carbohydrate deacetylase n=1 Tax=Sulfurospirillum sp. 1612 TaxID=3094835 RepID=UPI002F95A07D